ncbi:MAG TPA: PEGA domain-containing protein [Polyangiaceae bacterium]|nr:PEGA domain-containing protein [Polyangiaceae bacterium]
MVIALVALGTVLAVAATAEAQGTSTSKKLEAIRVRMEKGQALYVKGDYPGAAQVFEDGYKSYPYSAFLFNAGVCYQKLNDFEHALEKFRDYLRVDPNAPDAAKVNDRIAALEAARSALDAGVPEAGTLGDAGDAGPVDLDAGVPEAGAPPPPIVPDDDSAMKSLVVIETEPDGAPLRLYARTGASAAPFKVGGENPGWTEVQSTRSPANMTLAVGRYHLVVEKFRDFNVSETDIDVAPGHVLHFKANLSQGAFMAFLRVSSNVPGAFVYLDDPEKKKPLWGLSPHSELVGHGTHKVLVEAPGHEPLSTDVVLKHGEQKELEVKLVRVGYGVLRIHSNALEIKVEVDGQPKGSWHTGDPPLDIQLPSGPHQLLVTSPGRKDFEGQVDIPRGQVLPVHATMIQTYPRGGAWLQAIAGAAFIGAAVWAGTEADNIHEQLEADRAQGTLESDDSRATKGKWLAIGSNAGFGVGAILIGLATYNFIRDPLPDSSTQLEKPAEFDDPRKKQKPDQQARGPRLDVAPYFGSNSGGVVVGGKF